MCASCGKDHPAKGVQVDHIQPIGTERTWDEFIEGLFCEKTNLQVLCIACHKEKTLKEKNESQSISGAGKRSRSVSGRAKPTGS